MSADRFDGIKRQASAFLKSIEVISDFEGVGLGVCITSVDYFRAQSERRGLDAFFASDEIYGSKGIDSLAGRYAAKEAVREVFGKKIAYKKIVVLSSFSREPLVSFQSGDYKNVFVSITHEDDLAGAVAIGSDSGAGVGIDVTRIERIRRVLADQPNVLSRIFTKREIGELHNIAEDAAIKWVGKEAVSKALGIGIWHGASLQDVEILIHGDTVRVVLRGKWLAKAKERKFSVWRVGFVKDDEFMMGLVLVR